MENEVFVQSVVVTMKLPNGKVVTGKFTGLAMCGPDQWKALEEKSLGEALHGDQPIMFTAPVQLDKIITKDSDKHDIIDAIREELQQDHHDKLSD
jgi:hypothetical protein